MTFIAQTIVSIFPAYTVIRASSNDGITNINTQDRYVLGRETRSHGLVYSQYSAGTAASYAIKNNECPIESYNDAVKRGHSTHWISGLGSSISSHKRESYDVYLLEVGMVVRLEGRLFTIATAPNNNLQLVPVK